MSNKLREIEALGQAVWIDNLNRDLLDDGTMRDLIQQDGISGVTSNPTIFEKGMGRSDRYDDAVQREIAAESQRHAGDLREARAGLTSATPPTSSSPTFESTEGQDGYVSFELPASLAFDAQGSIDAAMRLHDLFERATTC